MFCNVLGEKSDTPHKRKNPSVLYQLIRGGWWDISVSGGKYRYFVRFSPGMIWIHIHQCYLFWYDNHKGWKFLSTTTFNRVDSVGWKHLRRFNLARLRGCAKCQQQNWNWGRAWLVNVKSSTPRKMEALFSYRGHLFSHNLCLHFTPRTALTAIKVRPMTGKHL